MLKRLFASLFVTLVAYIGTVLMIVFMACTPLYFLGNYLYWVVTGKHVTYEWYLDNVVFGFYNIVDNSHIGESVKKILKWDN